MGIVWTAEQLAAINETPEKMLVSAAAGSGKTAVLTERIIRELTDKQAPADISRFLIVTYTRAAAAQLKSKISSAIQSEAAAAPQNKALARQLVKLGNARISTIHSFCATVIKQNFERLSLSPSLHVCEAAQANEIKENVMSELIEHAYHRELPEIPDFHTFADNFVTGSDSRLADTFLSLYEKVNVLPNGITLWENAAMELASDIPFMQTKHGAILSLTLERSLSYCKQLYAAAEELLSRDDDIEEKYLSVLKDDLSVIGSLEALLEKHSDISEISKLLSTVTYTRLPSVSKQKLTEGALYFKQTAREAFKKEISELSKLFTYPVDAAEEAADATINNTVFADMRKKSAVIAGQTVSFLKEFDKRYEHEKRRLGMLDFSDLEQLTYRLLYNSDGSYSALSDVIAQDFDEIFIDEFQDVNPIQSLIFNAVSKKCRIFQVGDIKQSIYGFRGAAPDIFAECRRSYTQYTPGDSFSDATSEYGRSLTVFLSSNFRSAFPITEFVNRIFDVLFHTPSSYPNKNERIPYDASDRLLCGRSDTYETVESSEAEEHFKKVPTRGYTPISIFLISQQKSDRSEKSDTENISSKEAEATVLADKIAELISSGVSASDIAVLYRNEAHARQLERALKAFGIPTSNDKGEELTNAPEVQLALSLLECVDDPHKDIPLAGALRSPIFKVTLDELIHIRKSLPLKNGSLYTALCKYTEENGFEKGKNFISFTERIRKFSQGQSAARVLWEIYNETELFSLLYDGGAVSEATASARRANLLRLHKLALESEASGRDGIYTFLKRLRTLAGTKDAPKAAAATASGSVRFMTFHSSKGLEFEHCFVCGLGNLLSRSDSVSELVTDDELGIATKLRDSTGIVKYDTPFRRALSERVRYRQYEEELRVLYVALTRAKTALYLSAAVSDADKLISECRAAATSPEPFTFYRQSSRIKWIMTALYCEKSYVSPFSFELLRIRRINMTSDGYTEYPSVSENTSAHTENDGQYIQPTVTEPFPKPAQNASSVSDSGADDAAIPRYSESQLTRLEEHIRANISYKYPFPEAVKLPAKVSVSKLHPSLLDEPDTVSADELQAVLSSVSDTSVSSGEADVYYECDASLYPLKEAPQDLYPTEALSVTDDTEIERPRNQLKRPLFLTEPPNTEAPCQVSASDPGESKLTPIKPPPQYSVPYGPILPDSKNAAEIGTATHLFMQFCDFDNIENAGIEAELARLCERSLILPYHAAIADKTALERFFASELYKQMRRSTHLRREVRFNTRLSAAMFTSSPITAAALKDETLLVQGVIDCYFIDDDGKLILLDYKTDRFPPKMSAQAIAAILKKRHSLQLTYYKTALERLMLRPVDKALIFSFALGKDIPL